MAVEIAKGQDPSSEEEGVGTEITTLDLIKCVRHEAIFATKTLLTSNEHECFQWNMFWLLAYIMKLSKYRENLGRIEALRSSLDDFILNNNIQGLPGNDVAEHVSGYLIGDKHYYTTVLPNNIRSAINHLRGTNNYGRHLVHLKHATPFAREHSVGLFPGLGNSLASPNELNLNPSDLTMLLNEISDGGGAPPECWMIYQKCIFDSFEGAEIVQEFIEG